MNNLPKSILYLEPKEKWKSDIKRNIKKSIILDQHKIRTLLTLLLFVKTYSFWW